MTRLEEHEMILHLCEEIDRITHGDQHETPEEKVRAISDLTAESRRAVELEAQL